MGAREASLARLREFALHPVWGALADWFDAEIEAARDKLEKADATNFGQRQGEIKALRRLRRVMTATPGREA